MAVDRLLATDAVNAFGYSYTCDFRRRAVYVLGEIAQASNASTGFSAWSSAARSRK